MTDQTLPQTQQAVQLVAPDELVLNKEKAVFKPGPHQVLCLIEFIPKRNYLNILHTVVKKVKMQFFHLQKKRQLNNSNSDESIFHMPNFCCMSCATVNITLPN